jgi:small subunit ribosomal protein S4e
MLSKLGGIFAPKPSCGPHKLRECVPLNILLRNKLKLALNGREAKLIVKSKDGNIAIDGKIRKDPTFPVGFMVL